MYGRPCAQTDENESLAVNWSPNECLVCVRVRCVLHKNISWEIFDSDDTVIWLDVSTCAMWSVRVCLTECAFFYFSLFSSLVFSSFIILPTKRRYLGQTTEYHETDKWAAVSYKHEWQPLHHTTQSSHIHMYMMMENICWVFISGNDLYPCRWDRKTK